MGGSNSSGLSPEKCHFLLLSLAENHVEHTTNQLREALKNIGKI